MSTILSIVKVIFHAFIDYVIYLLTDLLVRRRIAIARTDHERCRIWRIMSVFLMFLSGFIVWFHHTPYFLWALIAMTFLMTVPIQYRRHWTSFCHRLSYFGFIRRWIPWNQAVSSADTVVTVPNYPRRFENGPQRFEERGYRQQVLFPERRYSPPSPRSFDCALAEFSPVPRRGLHGDSQTSGYGESETSPSTSDFTGISPSRTGGHFATSTPLTTWYSRRQSPSSFRQ